MSAICNVPSLFDLRDQVAIVTGGNGGLGLGMALGLAQAGAVVAIGARDPKKGFFATKMIEAEGGRAVFFPVDVRSKTSCVEMARDVARQLGAIDILVANAGVSNGGFPEEMAEEAWQATVDVNLNGSFFCSQAVHPFMRTRRGGKIVFVGSMTSLFGHPLAPGYGASKGAIVQLAKSLAVAWADDNIQVNTILPGWFETEIVESVVKDRGFYDGIVARTPARRWGVPSDLRGIIQFLCSNASQFVTGASIPVDGGYSAYC